MRYVTLVRTIMYVCRGSSVIMNHPPHPHPRMFRRHTQGGPATFWPNVARCFLMAIFLNAHIELYGLSQAYLGALVREKR